MRKTCTIVVLILTLCTLALAKKESVAELRARLETTELKKQPKIYRKIIEEEVKQVVDLFKSGDSEQGRQIVTQIGDDAEAAAKAAISSRKDMKKVEITLRKASDRLNDLSRGVEFDDRAPIKDTISRIEKTRTNLLTAMFK